MGDIICEHANMQILKQSLLKMLYQEHGGVPKYLYIDNGKDYTGFEMTGRSRKERHGNELAFEEEVRGFYKSIGLAWKRSGTSSMEITAISSGR